MGADEELVPGKFLEPMEFRNTEFRLLTINLMSDLLEKKMRFFEANLDTYKNTNEERDHV